MQFLQQSRYLRSYFSIGLVLAAALAAAMSTQDTVTHAAGSIFAQDLVEPLKKKKSIDKEHAD